jgi:ribonuclease Z
MILAGVSVTEITKIFITHFHGDHCLGLAGIIQRISLDRVLHEVDIYYPASGQLYYEHLRDSCLFHNSARLNAHPVSEGGVIFEDERITIEAKRLDHIVDCFGYRMQEKDSFTLIPEKLEQEGIREKDAGRLKATGRLDMKGKTICIEDVAVARPGQCFAFVMDTRVCEGAYALAHGADLCVMEATYLSDMEQAAHEYGHLTAHQAALIARDAGVKKLVLSHYSQRYSSMEEFSREASVHHGNVVVAIDGQTIPFPARKRAFQANRD